MVHPRPSSVYPTLVSCQSSSPILFPPGRIQWLGWDSGILPHSATELRILLLHDCEAVVEGCPLVTQGLLNYCPHEMFILEHDIRDHLTSPEEQVSILLSGKKYAIQVPSLLRLPGNHTFYTQSQLTFIEDYVWLQFQALYTSELNPQNNSTK